MCKEPWGPCLSAYTGWPRNPRIWAKSHWVTFFLGAEQYHHISGATLWNCIPLPSLWHPQEPWCLVHSPLTSGLAEPSVISSIAECIIKAEKALAENEKSWCKVLHEDQHIIGMSWKRRWQVRYVSLRICSQTYHIERHLIWKIRWDNKEKVVLQFHKCWQISKML